MPKWFYVILHLLFESFSARRDARIRFLQAQVTILRRKLGGNRVVVSPADRAELLRIGGELRHEVKDVLGIVTPQTYRRWVREREHGCVVRSVGRPRLGTSVRDLVRRLTRENHSWGYRRILGELRKLYIPIGRSSVRRILHEEGVLPLRWNRAGLHIETPWRKFIRLHMNTLVACDFFTQDIITPLGRKVAYCLFFLHLETRRVFLCPATYHPDERWVVQQARNVQMWLDDQGIEARFLLRDRDAKFSRAFDQLFRDAGTKIVKTPVQGPDANAFAESFVSNARRECLNHFLCFSLRHVDHIAGTWVRYYNHWRPHQSLGNRTLPTAQSGAPPPTALPDVVGGSIRCQRLLGGLLRHYYRVAA
jgi:putative transposase